MALLRSSRNGPYFKHQEVVPTSNLRVFPVSPILGVWKPSSQSAPCGSTDGDVS